MVIEFILYLPKLVYLSWQILATPLLSAWRHNVTTSALSTINEVNRRRARLILDGWLSNADGWTVWVCNLPLRSTQSGHSFVGKLSECQRYVRRKQAHCIISVVWQCKLESYWRPKNVSAPSDLMHFVLPCSACPKENQSLYLLCASDCVVLRRLFLRLYAENLRCVGRVSVAIFRWCASSSRLNTQRSRARTWCTRDGWFTSRIATQR